MLGVGDAIGIGRMRNADRDIAEAVVDVAAVHHHAAVAHDLGCDVLLELERRGALLGGRVPGALAG